MSGLPYFDYCLKHLKNIDQNVEKVFGRDVHWGYWEEPGQAKQTVDDFALASENLSQYLIQSSGIQNGTSVLDVGSGFGGTVASINEQFTKNELDRSKY